MARKACDGKGLLEAFRAAVANLEAHVDEINELNVYPVPDGDTGSNMFATVRAALDEAEAVTEITAERVAGAISFGALMGARGNSGVITSQIFRGMAEALGGKTRFNGLDLANALQQGAKTAYGAVAKPVEGTILTVIREAAEAAVKTAEDSNDIEVVMTATVDAAEKAVAKTPSLLAILREAGVVDSGGQGLFRLFQGALHHLKGLAPVKGASGAGRSAAAVPGSTLAARIDEGFGYETMFLLQAHPGKPLDVDAIRDHLESIGESVLVAGDARALKVHVHNERPDQVIGYGLGLGSMSKISVENLDNQARDVQEARATEFTGVETSTNGSSEETPLKPGPAIVAVVAGDGMARVYEEFGVDQILNGGQSANPSTGELLRVARLARSREVLLLPNNPNVRLAAEQAAAVCDDKRLVVVPTRNAAEGIAALFALDPTLDATANAGPMTEASRAIQSVQVTEAVRNATIGGKKVKQGQTIALDPDDGLVAVHGDPNKAVLAAVAAFEPGYELITLYYGADATLAEAEAMSKRIHDIAPGAEVEVVHGGQPHYRYLISAE
ncbi:MAG TPA: DAK2 domain-containing protein [Candidatus Limnocylindrales bacterium]|nr:DAK2 domain-containing protein [Candidatus Limnocylindrales bacterium]